MLRGSTAHGGSAQSGAQTGSLHNRVRIGARALPRGSRRVAAPTLLSTKE